MTKPILSCAAAKALGLKRYFNGRACVNGHLAERLTSNGTCIVCSNERLKAWTPLNRDKRRAACKKYDDINKDENRAKQRNFYAANKERLRCEAAARNAENPEARRASKRKWKKNNPHYAAEEMRRRFACKVRAYPAWANHEAILAIYEKCRKITQETGIVHHVDHIIPLRGKTVCGLHVHENLQIIPAAENWRKNNRMPEAA